MSYLVKQGAYQVTSATRTFDPNKNNEGETDENLIHEAFQEAKKNMMAFYIWFYWKDMITEINLLQLMMFINIS